MDDKESRKEVWERFQRYADLLNATFNTHDGSIERTQRQTRQIARELFDLGFVILSRIGSALRTIEPSEDTVQPIIIVTYEMLLAPRHFSSDEEEENDISIATAYAESKVCGPIVPRPDDEIPAMRISDEKMTWLRDALESLDSDKSNDNVSN